MTELPHSDLAPAIETYRRCQLPTTNADGKPIIPMTDEQRWLFDTKGWICLPGLLGEDELPAIREHMARWLDDRDALPADKRWLMGGAAQVLLDHPAVVGVLNDVCAHASMANEDMYGFRFDGSFATRRKKGHDNFSPHGGHGIFALNGNSHLYQMRPGQVHAGLTRVVWELNEVAPGDGGTLLLTGSHKAAFKRPESTNDRTSPLWETYSCPPGSVMIFTEALCHAGTMWSNPDRDRLAVFNCYNTIGAKWHPGGPPTEVIDTMPPKRQSLFRGVWTGAGEGKSVNRYYDHENQAV